jgi:hypothetical protein
MRTSDTHHRFGLERLEQRRLMAAGPSISVGDVVVMEGNSGAQNAVVTVSLSAASSKSVSVSFRTEDGTASAGSDYRAVAGKLMFAPGEWTKTIAVPVVGDRVAESDESFHVRLSAPSNGKIGRSPGVVTVRDNEPRMRISDVSLAEGVCRCHGPTPFNFTVSLSAAYDQAVTVNYATADGTATVADRDYDPAFGTLTFAPGETSKTITISGWGDSRIESDEQFFVNLSAPSSNTLIIDGQGIGTILEDDGEDEDPCTYVCCHPDGCGNDGGGITP